MTVGESLYAVLFATVLMTVRSCKNTSQAPFVLFFIFCGEQVSDCLMLCEAAFHRVIGTLDSDIVWPDLLRHMLHVLN